MPSPAEAWRRAGWVARAAAAAGMVATPLVRRGRRARLANLVVGGLAGAALGAAGRWGGRRAAVAGASTAAFTWAIERAATVTGVPFGRYEYTPELRPQVAGVPLAVPAAWFAMGLPARETAHSALGARSSPLARIGLGSALLTAWDLFLDPQMVGEGYWRWHRRGRYRGIPATNFVGWLATGAAVMALLEVILPPGEPQLDLVATYGFVALMQTLGFAAFFGDPTVALVGGLAMLPAAAVAFRRAWSGRG